MQYTVPDPMADPEGYELWCELHACDVCGGTGEIEADDIEEWRTCRRCGGSGIDYEPEIDPVDEQ